MDKENNKRINILQGNEAVAEGAIAARYIKETGYPKKIIAYIAGSRAPEKKKMGHAGVIVTRKMDEIMANLL